MVDGGFNGGWWWVVILMVGDGGFKIVGDGG